MSFTILSYCLVYSSFWNLIPFSLPARPVSALDGLLWIKFCFFLSPFWMGLTNLGRVHARSQLLLISRKLLTLSGIPLFSANSFRLASLLALLVGLNFSFLVGALVWFIKIIKVVPFESVEEFCKNPFLALYFSVFSSMISLLLCLLPSAFSALFVLTMWPFGPPPPPSLLRWKPHRKLWIDCSAGLSTDVFLLIRANERFSSSQCIPTKLTFIPTSSYSTPASASIPPQLFLESLSTAFFFFLNMFLQVCQFFPRFKALRYISASSCGSSKESISLSSVQSFSSSPSDICFTRVVSFSKRYQYHQIRTPPPSG